MPIFSYAPHDTASIKTRVEVPLTLEPFRIRQSSKLGDWEAGEILTMTASEPNVQQSRQLPRLNSERIDMTLETSGFVSKQSDQGAIGLMDLKFPFFQLGEPKFLGNGQTDHVHTRHSHHVRRATSQFFQLPVKFLVRCEVSRFGASHQGFIFQSVFLRPVLVHVESLRFHKLVAPFHHWRQYRVDSPQHERGKKHDTQPQRKGTQERVHVYGFGTCERLPHFGGYIEQSSQPGYPFGYPPSCCCTRASFHRTAPATLGAGCQNPLLLIT